MGGKGSGIGKEIARIHRVNEFWDMVLLNPKKSEDEIVAKFSFNYGTCRRTVLDYVKILILNKKIKRIDGFLLKF